MVTYPVSIAKADFFLSQITYKFLIARRRDQIWKFRFCQILFVLKTYSDNIYETILQKGEGKKRPRDALNFTRVHWNESVGGRRGKKKVVKFISVAPSKAGKLRIYGEWKCDPQIVHTAPVA